MEKVSTVVTLLGAIVLTLGLGSKRLEQTAIPIPLLALVIGILIGPAMLGIIDLREFGSEMRILENAARLTLGIGLVGVALRIPKSYGRQNLRSMAVLLGLGMPLMWAFSTLAIHLILGIHFWIAALIGAMVAATDPIAAGPIVTGPVALKNIPGRIRHAISFESGANDGLSYLFVFLPFLLLTQATDDALSHWLARTLLWEVGVATLFGVLLGVVAGKLLQWAEARDYIEDDWRLVYTVALSLLAVGAGRLIASDEVLVVFAAGVAFAQTVSSEDRKEEERGQEAVNRFFTIPIFTLLGVAIPWDGWALLGWSGLLLAVAVLLLRRPVVLLLLRPLLPNVRNVREALFMGWFGPIAVAAIYYAVLMHHRFGDERIWPVVSLLICASVLVHGVSATPLTRWYGRTGGQESVVVDDPEDASA